MPWFPYPSVGVAELNPPNYDTKTTSWNFTNILPQFTAFMNATYGRGHSVIPNFSTQPTWMYDTNDWSYPSDPNDVDWNYPQGNAYSNTTANVAAYYGRLLSWIMKVDMSSPCSRSHAFSFSSQSFSSFLILRIILLLFLLFLLFFYFSSSFCSSFLLFYFNIINAELKPFQIYHF